MKLDDKTGKSQLEIIAEILLRHAVEFIVIGGQAEVLYGSARVTADVDLCHRRSRENLDRLAEALREIKPTLRDAPANLPFRVDAVSLGLGSNFTFSTTVGDLDLLGQVDPIGNYESLLPTVRMFDAGGLPLPVIGLEHLIRIKEYLHRPKDQLALVHLRAIQRLQEAGRGDGGAVDG